MHVTGRRLAEGAHPRHPRLPQAGRRVQGHHAAPRRRRRLPLHRRRPRRSLRRSDASTRCSASRPGASSSPRRSRTASAPASCPVRKAGKLPWEIEQEEYALEYGTDLLEIHRDAVRAGRAGADRRRRAGHRRHRRAPPSASSSSSAARSSGSGSSSSWRSSAAATQAAPGYDVVSLIDVRVEARMATVDRVLPWRRQPRRPPSSTPAARRVPRAATRRPTPR